MVEQIRTGELVARDKQPEQGEKVVFLIENNYTVLPLSITMPLPMDSDP